MTPQQIYLRALERLRRRIATMERTLNGASLSVHEEFEELCLIIPLIEQHIVALSRDPCSSSNHSASTLNNPSQSCFFPPYQTLNGQAIYAILSIEVCDSEEFSAIHWEAIEQYGGRLLVAHNPYEVVKGTWCPNRIVIQRWPNIDTFQHWFKNYGLRTANNNALTISSLLLVEAVENEVAYN